MNHQYIAIEGSIGAGKTTLATMLANHFKANLLLEEFADNPFLPKFYENPERHAFPVELYFLADRYHQLKARFANPDLFQQLTVADYFIGKSLIFSRSNLADDEYQLFSTLFQIMFSSLPKPDLLVYLYLDVDKLLINIKKRGRPYEQDISSDYLDKVQKGYLHFLRQQPGLTVVVLDTNELDFVEKTSDFNKVLNLLSRKYPSGVHMLSPKDL
jgi:deoxyadenosine/deoxycytidine kinase